MRSTKQPEMLLPVKLFAQRLGISTWTARQMAYSGRIASCKIGAKLLIPAAEVDRVIAETMRPRREEPTAALAGAR